MEIERTKEEGGDAENTDDEFYVRYYVGHKGKFGHEFLEFEVRNGLLRYANNSKYKGAGMIRKNVHVSDSVVEELKRIIQDSEIMKESDNKWPQPNNGNFSHILPTFFVSTIYCVFSS